MKKLMPILLVNDSWGIHVPRRFFENYDFPPWGLKEQDYPELQDIDHPEYWDAFEDVLQYAKHEDEHGNVWELEMHEGSLFAVHMGSKP